MHFEAIFRASPNPYVLLTPELVIIEANDAYLRATGRKREDLLGYSMFDAFPANPASGDDRQVRELRASFNRVLTERAPHTLALIKYSIPRENPDEGRVVFDERYWSATNSPVFDDSGQLVAIVQHTVDVTDIHNLKQSERADSGMPTDRGAGRTQHLGIEGGMVRRADRVQQDNMALDAERTHLRRMFQQAPGFMAFLRGKTHVFEIANAAYYQLVGRRDIIGKPITEALPEMEAQGFMELLDRVYKTGEPFVGHGLRVLFKRVEGQPAEEAFVDVVCQPMVDAQGQVMGIFVQGHEITAQKLAQDELREYQNRLEELVRERTEALAHSEAERRAAEAALHHAQKLEAVGKLTGGVAHDFNNVLQVIGGNLELLRSDTTGNADAQRRVRSAIGAVEKGARLASQLLAFARRQPLEPVVTNVGRLLTRMDELLRRVLGETIQLETISGGGLWLTCVDPNRLENVVLNLAINARDAMSGEGRLTLEAGNAMLDEHYASLHAEVTPGQYVMLAVTDTGHGMSDAVQQRAFEPFFTTKPEGQGTGLGLSMVYGFVKQSGGHVKIYSEVGHGTVVKIYLPRSHDAETATTPNDFAAAVGGEETILVVEDDPEVRSTVVETLGALGYRVLKASDGQSALAIVESGAQIDLLFTDVVMPGPLRSPDLAKRAKALQPDLQVLFTSGYTENAIVHGGRLDPGVNLLSKPYRRDDLARKVRQVLRGGPQRAMLQPMTTQISAQSPTQGSDGLAAPRSYDSLSLLYVEDHEDTRIAIGECLEALGHQVVTAGSAEEALVAVESRSFDALFTDITLPGMSGIDLAAKLATDRPRMRVIIASGYGRDARVNALGPDVVVLQKPYDIAAMETALANVGASLKVIDATAGG
ncbi:hypothetical protein BH09PSE5_BH09PSE5_01380 [soil metagenome]